MQRALAIVIITILRTQNVEEKMNYNKELEIYNLKKKMAKKVEDIVNLRNQKSQNLKPFLLLGISPRQCYISS